MRNVFASQIFAPPLLSLLLIASALVTQPLYAQNSGTKSRSDVAVRSVPIAELQAAMDLEAARDYDATATTNSGRFFAAVIIDLARQAQAIDPNGPPLLLRHTEWYQAFLNAAGLESHQAPTFVALAFQNRQDVLVDYDIDGVIESVDGEQPRLALNVQLGWPDLDELPKKYSFADTLADPNLQITYHRVVRHRLVDFGDVVLLDEIDGLTGRPTTGFLSAFFRLIGEGQIDWSRIYVADDRMQVTRGSAHKGPFKLTETIYVQPNGTGNKDVPNDDPKWMKIEQRLKAIPSVTYKKWSLPDFDDSW